jgi:hypothetical protein
MLHRETGELSAKLTEGAFGGAEALVVRRYSDDGVRSYMHGAINGLVK